MGEQVKTSENQVIRNEKGQVISGTPNPNGRPKGTYSLKTLIEKKLRENPELEAKLIADILEKEQALVYQMIDGRPKQVTELDAKVEMSVDPETKNKVEGNIDSLLGLIEEDNN
tara:strand:+ start:4837 stop:5178 length:342 start_codon:yes stop_codon:yes gene_type:complete